jgi:hypothetical protein
MERAEREAPVTAEEAAELGAEILSRLQSMRDRPFALIAGLKSAAASVENAINSNTMKAAVTAALSSLINNHR